jgi:hypothetical protein
MTPSAPSGDSPALADLVAEAVLAHPSVLRLHGGDFGVTASHLPGRKVVGVRVGEAGERIEVAVVLRLDRPLPDIVADLRSRVREVAGAVKVDITVSDVVTEQEPEGQEPEGARRPSGAEPGEP